MQLIVYLHIMLPPFYCSCIVNSLFFFSLLVCVRVCCVYAICIPHSAQCISSLNSAFQQIICHERLSPSSFFLFGDLILRSNAFILSPHMIRIQHCSVMVLRATAEWMKSPGWTVGRGQRYDSCLCRRCLVSLILFPFECWAACRGDRRQRNYHTAVRSKAKMLERTAIVKAWLWQCAPTTFRLKQQWNHRAAARPAREYGLVADPYFIR